MSNIQLFQNPEFGKLEVLVEGGRVLFPASDVARMLGYTNPHKAVQDHCRNIEKRRTNDSLGRQQESNYIPEGDIIRLVVKSKLPEAQRIESWIFDEVVPTVLKTGTYSTPKADDEVKMLRAKAMATNAEVRKAKLLMEATKEFANLLSAQSSELLAINAIEVLTGQNTLPRPKVDMTYSAEEIGREVGLSANAIGRLANKHNLKTDEYGMTVLDKSRSSDSQFPTFRYNMKGKAEIVRLAKGGPA